MSEEEAFKQSVESITGPISRIISTEGMPAVYDRLDAEGKKVFEQAYSASFGPALDICLEIYEVRGPSCLGLLLFLSEEVVPDKSRINAAALTLDLSYGRPW